MTFSDWKSMDTTAAMELLSAKLRKASDTLHPKLLQGEVPDVDTLLEWASLAALSKAFALSVLQAEVEETGGTGRLRPTGHAALQLYEDADWLQAPAYGCIDGTFPAASDLVDSFFKEVDGLPQEAEDAMDELLEVVQEDGLLDIGEALHIFVSEAGDVELGEGCRPLARTDKVALYAEVAKDALVRAGMMGDGDVLVLATGPSDEDERDGCPIELTGLSEEEARLVAEVAGPLFEAGLLGGTGELAITREDGCEGGPGVCISMGDGRTLSILLD